MDDETSITSTFKQPIPTLTRRNWRTFFEDLELWLTSRGVFYTCQYTEKEYCTIKGFGNLVGAFEKASTPGDSSKEQEKENVNYEKVDKFRKDSAGALFILNKCIDSFDRDFIKEHTTNKAKWTTLITKYKKAKPADIRGYEMALTHWKKDTDMSIDHSWTKLKELRRHLTEADPNTNIDEAKLLITVSDDSVKLWDGLSGSLRKEIKGQFVRPLIFNNKSPATRFVTVDVKGAEVTTWDAET